MKFDEIDKQILHFLQKDAKMTTKEIAFHLKLSTTAIYERIKKLEKEGVVQKYIAVLDKEKIDKNFMVYCHVRLEQHVRKNVEEFERQIIKLPEVLECIHVSGDYDYILKVYVKNMKEYRNFLVDKLTALKGIGNTQSNFMLNEVKNTTLINF